MNLHSLNPNQAIELTLEWCREYFPTSWIWGIENNQIWYRSGRYQNERHIKDEEYISFSEKAQKWADIGKPSLRRT